MIQTDAAITLENSGGALLDSQGKLIADQPTMIFNGGGAGASAGLGFAIQLIRSITVVPH